MKYLRPFKLYEEAVTKPIKKFPTDKAIHWDYIVEILGRSNIDADDNLKKGQRGTSFLNFCFDKCSGKMDVVFPKLKDTEPYPSERDERLIFGESVFLLPENYDNSNDKDLFLCVK